MSAQPLLIELLTEELPPKALQKLGEAFAAGIAAGLEKDGLISVNTAPQVLATPRRLAVLFPEVGASADDKEVTTKLMPTSVGLDAAGNPTEALRKKIRSYQFGIDVGIRSIGWAVIETDEEGKKRIIPSETRVFGAKELPGLERIIDEKTDLLQIRTLQQGMQLSASLQRALDATLSKLPIPKEMNYQLADGETTVQFVRPAHRLTALHGTSVLPVEILGIKADRITDGHRFQGEKNISIPAVQNYLDLLATKGNVIASFAARRAEIEAQLQEKANALGFNLGEYDDLLNEVTALVEMPTVYVAQFEKEFLTVPQECLILTMRTNQKYFPLFDAKGKLVEKFLLVSNMRLADATKIIEGNQRVVRPRLADARFFFETDKKTTLESRLPELAKVVYHNQLGSQGERGQRLSALAGNIAALIGADVAKSKRAANLMKADLQTLMVGEFPELQGIMGRTYALNDGEAPDIAAACEEHYKPRFAGDSLPSVGVPTACALADKLETLAGLFGVGQVPTGDKDPFALRRHSLGVLRIIMEQKITVPLSALVSTAFAAVHNKATDATPTLLDFIYERLRGVLREQGYSANEVEAVLAQRPDRLDRLGEQLAAVRAFMALEEAQSLIAANKRVANILRKAQESKTEIAPQVSTALLTDAAEQTLHRALLAAIPAAQKAFDAGDYAGYLKSFAALKAPVDAFFTDVMVMVDDEKIRANRLALLRDLRDAMNRVADISKLAAS